MQTDCDIAVIGLGAIGSMALWRLAEKGVAVLGFEQFGIGHDRGAVGGETRLFRRAQTADPRFTPLIDIAYKNWLELNEHSDIELLKICGGLTVGQADDQRILATLEAARMSDLDVEVLGPRQMRERFPEHHLTPDEIGVYDPTQGYMRCEQAVIAAVRQARALGAEAHAYTPVRISDVSADSVTLSSDTREWTAKKVVIAAGGWSGHLLPSSVKKRCSPKRIMLSWFAPRRGHDFSVEQFPVFHRMTDGGAIYGAPSLDGGASVKVARGAAPTEIEDVNHFERGHSREEIEFMEARVAKHLPGLESSPIRVGSWVDFYPEDWTPLMGPVVTSR
ncbi:FAD-dependent oxidoreductase [Arthrobacter sp. VKM Ac-2550]|uniref:FAD-dependent oxidoreductase n=1 Tax=Crystallibacter permensis TaxID=1938888 RepID=UPI002227A09A|nr:FAD-dependent oxidoreductase [Arthrobacter sp. VKM Ac-2550]MCW2130859.1 sarcosine oxidase [Arthrobacter sp. VKM Ac-2550]